MFGCWVQNRLLFYACSFCMCFFVEGAGLNVGSATVKVNALFAAFVLTVSICMSQVLLVNYKSKIQLPQSRFHTYNDLFCSVLIFL